MLCPFNSSTLLAQRLEHFEIWIGHDGDYNLQNKYITHDDAFPGSATIAFSADDVTIPHWGRYVKVQSSDYGFTMCELTVAAKGNYIY